MPMTNGEYVTPGWNNGQAPAINANELTAMGRGIETGSRLYGVCSTAANVVNKVVTVNYSGTLALYAGLAVKVKFTNGNSTIANLNVNGTGYWPVYVRGQPIRTGGWSAGDTLVLVYDGSRWNIAGGAPVQVELAVIASAWQGSAAPYTASIAYDGVTAASIGRLVLSPSATAAQRSAYRDAMIAVTGQSAGAISLAADGVKPTVSLTFVLTLE